MPRRKRRLFHALAKILICKPSVKLELPKLLKVPCKMTANTLPDG